MREHGSRQCELAFVAPVLGVGCCLLCKHSQLAVGPPPFPGAGTVARAPETKGPLSSSPHVALASLTLQALGDEARRLGLQRENRW